MKNQNDNGRTVALTLQNLTVIESKAVVATITKMSQSMPRLQDAWDGLIWKLSRNGQRLGAVGSFGQHRFRVYKQASDSLANTPNITVVYTVSENEITILDVRIT